MNETEEERGIAHMLEHLAFRSQKVPMDNDDSGEDSDFGLVHKLEELGIEFGACQVKRGRGGARGGWG